MLTSIGRSLADKVSTAQLVTAFPAEGALVPMDVVARVRTVLAVLAPRADDANLHWLAAPLALHAFKERMYYLAHTGVSGPMQMQHNTSGGGDRAPDTAEFHQRMQPLLQQYFPPETRAVVDALKRTNQLYNAVKNARLDDESFRALHDYMDISAGNVVSGPGGKKIAFEKWEHQQSFGRRNKRAQVLEHLRGQAWFADVERACASQVTGLAVDDTMSIVHLVVDMTKNREGFSVDERVQLVQQAFVFLPLRELVITALSCVTDEHEQALFQNDHELCWFFREGLTHIDTYVQKARQAADFTERRQHFLNDPFFTRA